jgi:hypothetical protein
LCVVFPGGSQSERYRKIRGEDGWALQFKDPELWRMAQWAQLLPDIPAREREGSLPLDAENGPWIMHP